MVLVFDFPPELMIENPFVAYGITCGPIGYNKLIQSEWYKNNKAIVDNYIFDYKTLDQIKIIAIPSTIHDLQSTVYNRHFLGRLLDWKDCNINVNYEDE